MPRPKRPFRQSIVAISFAEHTGSRVGNIIAGAYGEQNMNDHFKLELSLKTADGRPIPDGPCTVNIKKDGLVWRELKDITKGGVFAGAVLLPNPPAPLSWELLSNRFKPHEGENFLPPPEGSTKSFEAILFRTREGWTPDFTALIELATPRFDRLRAVLAISDQVDLKTGGILGNLNETFDSLTDAQAVLGKMALLNLYSVLTDEQDPIAGCPWFDHVQRLVRLDQERFIAEVDAALYENVQTIINHIGDWKPKGYFLEASTCLHSGNIPARYPAPALPTISVKKRYEQGNLQLTLSFIRDEGRPVHILDCDMDEHANIALHTADIEEHEFTRGTSPVEMFDYICRYSAARQEDDLSRCDFGYTLA